MAGFEKERGGGNHRDMYGGEPCITATDKCETVRASETDGIRHTGFAPLKVSPNPFSTVKFSIDMCRKIVAPLQPSRDLAMAQTKLDEAEMWFRRALCGL